jgi:hypothetical protein
MVSHRLCLAATIETVGQTASGAATGTFRMMAIGHIRLEVIENPLPSSGFRSSRRANPIAEQKREPLTALH